MTQQPFSSAALRGAVDLGALAAANQRRSSSAGSPGGASGAAGGRAAGPAGPGGPGGPGGSVVDVTELDFQELVIEQSMTVPVVVDLWSARAQASVQMSAVLDKLAADFAGAFLLAHVDVDTNPALVQAFQVQTLPFVVAVLKGQPVPLAADVLPEAQLRQVLDKLLEVAAQNGVTGRLTAEPGAAPDALPAEPELPPLHQAAYDAIDGGDFAAAAAAYEQAIKLNPADELAIIGLINVRLMQRTDGVDAEAALQAAADPDDTAAQLLAADVELLAGRLPEAFDRLVEAVRSRTGAEREEVRRRLVELFSLVGGDDPDVRRARIALTNALF